MRFALAAALLLAACGRERIDVRGTAVRGSVYRVEPVAGALVSVAGRPAVATDDQGRFSVDGVEPPYAVLVGNPEHTFAEAWLGLRRSDPVLVLDDPVPPVVDRSASVTGFVTGLPVDGTNPAWAYLQTPIGVPTEPLAVNAAYGDYSASASWVGPEAITGVVHVLQVAYARGPASTGTATGFPLYGRLEGVPLTSGQTTRDVDFALTLLASSPARVRASVPAGSQANFSVIAHFGVWGGHGFPLAGSYAPQPWPDFAVPVLAGVRVHVWVTAWDGTNQTNAHRTLGWEGGDLEVHLDTPPRPLEPAAGATGVGPGSRFSWSPFASGDVYVLQAFMNSGYPPRFQVVTDSAAVAFPEFAAVGVPLPGGQAAGWTVTAMGPTGGVDRVASTDHLGFAFHNGFGESDFEFTLSDGHAFSTR